jgi:MoaA/NifB/PqqE/SkfB family radical SAM enzyme
MQQSFWTRFFPHKFDWLQIAVTSQCNASCAYCPHTVYRRHWQSRHLSLATYHRLVPDLEKIKLIYLQGWGEPFLNPDFFTFVSLAKQAGCQVGTTTNATLCTEASIARIVESGMDILAFSLAGIGETHNAWRQGTDYHQVLEAIRSLQDCKRRLGQANPRVHIAYMLLRSGLKDLDKLPQELKGLGIRQVVISTLDLVTAPELEKESLAGVSETEAIDISQSLVEVADVGAKNDLPIYYPDLAAHNQRRECHENVLGTAVVSVDGDISPCVFTNIPTLAGNYYIRGEAHKIESMFFGNVKDLSLREIWRQPDYVSFRRSWKGKNFPRYCRNCLKLK